VHSVPAAMAMRLLAEPGWRASPQWLGWTRKLLVEERNAMYEGGGRLALFVDLLCEVPDALQSGAEPLLNEIAQFDRSEATMKRIIQRVLKAARWRDRPAIASLAETLPTPQLVQELGGEDWLAGTAIGKHVLNAGLACIGQGVEYMSGRPVAMLEPLLRLLAQPRWASTSEGTHAVDIMMEHSAIHPWIARLLGGESWKDHPKRDHWRGRMGEWACSAALGSLGR
jgi:hypothetical protein